MFACERGRGPRSACARPPSLTGSRRRRDAKPSSGGVDGVDAPPNPHRRANDDTSNNIKSKENYPCLD